MEAGAFSFPEIRSAEIPDAAGPDATYCMSDDGGESPPHPPKKSEKSA